MLISIQRNGLGAEELNPYLSAALMSLWEGTANPGQIKSAQAFTVDLHFRSRWLMCTCVGNNTDPNSRPYGNPPDKPKTREVEFSKKEVLREEVKIYRQPDHGCIEAC